MEPKKVGRTLGIGVRVASNMLRERVRTGCRSPSSHRAAGNGWERPRRLRRRQQSQYRNRVAGVKRGAKAFGQAFLGPFTHAGSVLWLEITGLFFALFAVFFAQSVYRVHAAWRQGPEHTHLLLYVRPDRSLRLVLGELVSSRLSQEQAGPRVAKIDQTGSLPGRGPGWLRPRSGPSGGVSLHPGHPVHHVPGPRVGHAPILRDGGRGAVESALSNFYCPKAVMGFRSRSTFLPRLATIPTPPGRPARWAGPGWRSTPSKTWNGSLPASRSRRFRPP